MPVLFAALLPGALLGAFAAFAFCGVPLRQAVNPAVLLGVAAAGLTLAAERFDMDIWVRALLLLALGGAVLVLALRKEADVRAAPGAVLFCALRLMDGKVVVWLTAPESEGGQLALGLLWLGLLLGGLCAAHAAFPDKVWAEAKSGQPGPGGMLRLALLLFGMALPPLIAVLLDGLFPRSSAGARIVQTGVECLLLCTAAACCRLLLLAGQKDRRLLENRQSQQELYHFMAIIRSQRHDYNLHLHTIASLLREGRYEESRNYIADVVADSREVNVMMKIKDPMIGALISGYRDLAREQGCELDIVIADDLSALVSTPYDTNRILGNLLQNALDEAAGHAVQDKTIRLETLRRGGNCVIRVSNAVEDTGYLEHLFEYGFSGKQAHEGIGLNSVMRILELYKGSIYYELNGNRVEFVVRIPSRI